MRADWPVVRLGEYVRVKHGFAFRGEDFGDSGDHIVLTPGNFHDGGGFKAKSGTEKFYTTAPPPEYVLGRNDLVIAMTEQAQGLLGSSALIPYGGLYLHNQRIGLVELLSPEVDRRFLYYIFNTRPVRAQIQATATGSKVRHTAPSRVEDVTVALPPLPTQRKIAAVLSAYDDLIENHNRRTGILEEMAQRIYREWFIDFRYPGHENVPLIDSELGSQPEGWRVAPYTEVAEVLSGGTPKTTDPANWGGTIPFFTPRDAPACVFVHDTEKHLTDRGLSNCHSPLYPAGTVFITARGTVGKVAMAGSAMAMNQSCYALRGRDETPQEFVLYSLIAQVDYLRTNTGGATFDTIIGDTFRRMRVTLPPMRLAQAFAAAVRPLLCTSANLSRACAILRRTRDFVLPRLMSGEIDVEDLDIDVPEVAA